MKTACTLVFLTLLATTWCAAQQPAPAAPINSQPSPGVTKEIEEMKAAIADQQKQIEQMKQQLDLRDQALHKTQEQLNHLEAAAAEPAPAAAQPTLQNAAYLVNAAATTASAQAEKNPPQDDGPLSLHFKGITLTPGGFAAAETVYRNRATASDINTSFSAVPLPGSSDAGISEFYGSGRQSRISMLANGDIGSVKIGSYYEADFLSAAVTSNNNQSNSYSLRQRQFWGQAAFDSGWTITGGQMWSLITETRQGMDNRSEATPLTIDAQYQVGFSWARQYGVRATKNFGNKFWLGFSVENPQATLTAHGTPTNPNFLLGSSGTTGGLYNSLANYAFNLSPDVVVKAAFEPGWGHYEIFGVFSEFRDRVFPCANAGKTDPCSVNMSTSASALGAFNDSRSGGGFGFNARMPVVPKRLDIGLHAMGGEGLGRYGSAGLSDVTVRPDGTLSLIRNYQSFAGLEFHATPKLDFYAYVGGEYNARTWHLNLTTGKDEGYGAPGFANYGCFFETAPSSITPAGATAGAGFIPGALSNCTADTRLAAEGTLGFWYRFYKGSKGTFQLGGQYSYFERYAWSGVGSCTVSSTNTCVNGGSVVTNGTPTPLDNMFFTSLRYYLP